MIRICAVNRLYKKNDFRNHFKFSLRNIRYLQGSLVLGFIMDIPILLKFFDTFTG